MTTSTMAESASRPMSVTAAFMGSDGTVWHARCDQPLAYHGIRGGGLMVDFFCSDCQEHVSLPLRSLPNLDMDRETGPWAPRFALTHSD